MLAVLKVVRWYFECIIHIALKLAVHNLIKVFNFKRTFAIFSLLSETLKIFKLAKPKGQSR